MDLTDYRRKYGHSPAARLATFRARHGAAWTSARSAAYATLRGYPGAGTWQPDAVHQKSATAYYVEKPEQLPGRYVDTVPAILSHCRNIPLGYYTNDDMHETVRGFVMQLPGRNGAPRYYPAVEWSDSDVTIGYPLDWYDSKDEAARAADYHAEKAAEVEREENRLWRAQMEQEEREEALEALTAEYQAECTARGWPQLSADELMAELQGEHDSALQWLADFIRRWDAAS